MNDAFSLPTADVTIELPRMAPGPRLGEALARLPDLSTLSSNQLAQVLDARARQIAHEQAQMLVAARQLAHRVQVESMSESPRQHSPRPTPTPTHHPATDAAPVSGALRCTTRQAQQYLQLATELVVRLPVVLAALNEGRLDLRRAQLFAEQLRTLDDAAANAIATKLIDKASEWSQTALRRSLRYHVLRADPSQARSAGQRGPAGREFAIYRRPNGTATIVGKNVPLAAALCVDENLDRLAAVAKQGGDPRPFGVIRADVAVELLCSQPLTDRVELERSRVQLTTSGDAPDTTRSPAGFDKHASESDPTSDRSTARRMTSRGPRRASAAANRRSKRPSGRRGKAGRVSPHRRR